MKTVGQILKSERLKKSISLEHLSMLTKIDVKYIEALENDDYGRLPAETFIKGFIRNISLRLDKDPDELTAIFRRDFRHPQKQKPEQGLRQKKIALSALLSYRLLPFLLGGVVFFVYLGFQFRAIITPPRLEISQPANQSILTSPIEINGRTEVGAQVTINGDTQAKTDPEGNFSAKLSLPIGEMELEIQSINRFGRSTSKKIPLTIISK